MATVNLTIGHRYDPANKINNPDGTSTNAPIVVFYFNCDAQTAKMVDGMGVSKGLKANGNSLIKKVYADKYREFIGSAVFQKIIDALERYGYVYDMNSRDALADSVQQEIDNFAKSGLQKKINADVSSFIEQLIEAMQKNLNDPNFMAYFNSIGKMKKCNIGGEEIDKLVEFSVDNQVLALTQWLNAGNQGSPYYIATKKQFRLAGYAVDPNATPMYLMIPKRTELTKRSKQQAINDLGITDYDTNDKRKIDVEKLSNDINYGHNNVNKFELCPFPFYSINQCTEIRNSNLKDYLANNDHTDINIGIDKDAQAKMKSDILTKIELENQNVITDSAMCQNAKKYADNKGDKKLSSLATRGDAAGVINFLVNNAETYLRNEAQRYAPHTGDSKKLLEALALKKMGLNTDYADREIMSRAHNLKLNKQLLISVTSDLENIYNILTGLAESVVNNDMLMFVLNSCGISVDEFKHMPNTEHEANEIYNGVRENFVRIFNKLLIIH